MLFNKKIPLCLKRKTGYAHQSEENNEKKFCFYLPLYPGWFGEVTGSLILGLTRFPVLAEFMVGVGVLLGFRLIKTVTKNRNKIGNGKERGYRNAVKLTGILSVPIDHT